MEPHWRPLSFEQKPSYITVCKVWKDFVRTGLIVPSKPRIKLAPKSPKLSRADEETSAKTDSRSLLTTYSFWGILMLCLLMAFILSYISAQEPRQELEVRNSKDQHELALLRRIDEIRSKYAGSLTAKHIKSIRARLEMMRKEVSVLLLLGRRHDIQCQTDKTFCIGQAIANVSRYPQYGYIDARDARLNPRGIISELSEVLDERNDVMVIDSLERLPGNEVMSLFQFVDRVEMNKRRKGLLLLIMYTDKNLDDTSMERLRDAEIVEQLLVPKWSRYVRGDTLTSVISRISGTILRVR